MSSLDSSPRTELNDTLFKIIMHRDKYVSLMRKLFKLELRMDPNCINSVLRNRVDEAYARFCGDLYEFGVHQEDETEGEFQMNESRSLGASVKDV